MFASAARFWLIPLFLLCAAPALALDPVGGLHDAAHGGPLPGAPGAPHLIGAPGLPPGANLIAPPPHLDIAYGAGGELLTVWNGRARLWNGADGTPLRAWGCEAPVEAAWFTADGTRLIARHGAVGDGQGVNAAGTVALAVDDGRVLNRWPGLLPVVDADGRLQATRDGRALLGRAGDGFRLLYMARGGQGPRMVHKGATHAALSPDGQYVLTGAADGSVQLWRTDNAQKRLTRRQDGPVAAVAFSFDGAHAVTASAGGATVWTVPDGQEVFSGDDPGAVFSPSGPYLLELRGNSAVLRRLADGTPACTWRHKLHVADFGFAEGGTRLFVVGPTRAEVWQVQDCEDDKRRFTLMQRPRIQQFAMAPDGAQSLTAGGGMARLWVYPTRKRPTAMFMNWPNPGGGAYPARFAPDGTRLATAESAAAARIVAVPSGAVLATIHHGDDGGHCAPGQAF